MYCHTELHVSPSITLFIYNIEFTSFCFFVHVQFWIYLPLLHCMVHVKYTDFNPPTYLYIFSELPPPVTLYMNNYTDFTSFSLHNQLQINNLQDFLQVFVCATFLLHVVVRVRVDNLISEGS